VNVRLMELFRSETDPYRRIQSANNHFTGTVIARTELDDFDGVKDAVETYKQYLKEVNNEHDN